MLCKGKTGNAHGDAHRLAKTEVALMRERWVLIGSIQHTSTSSRITEYVRRAAVAQFKRESYWVQC